MSVMPVADQAPVEQVQSVEDRIASRFGETPKEQPAEEAPAEDLFELDFGGEKYQLPAKLKESFMLQKDYTQKTQEIAEQRRAYEHTSELAKSAQLERAFHESIGAEQQELSVIDAYLQQMQKANWSEMSTDQVLKTKIELDNVKERKATLKESIADKRGKFDTEMKARISELRTKAKELASKSISGFSEEAEKSMRSYASSVGLTEAEIDNVLLDPRSFRVIHDAMQYQKVASAAKPALAKPSVLKPGPASERMPQEVVDKFAYQKAIAKAKSKTEVNQLIEERLSKLYAKRK